MSTNRSYAAAFRAMTAAFLEAEAQILGQNRTWIAANAKQRRLLEEILPFTRPEAELIPETKQCVAWEAGTINSFLTDNGMDIRLEEFGADTFGFASVMKVACPWLAQGTPRRILIDDEPVEGARLEAKRVSKGMSVAFSRSPHFSEPIATILTTSNDVVRITKFNEDLDPFDLVARAREMVTDAKPVFDFDGVQFPFVDLDVCPDVSWLLGMSTVSETRGVAELVQALAQVKLQMNHKGAVVKDAFAGAAMLECCVVSRPKPDLIVDGSFLFVLDRPGLTQPVISLVVRPDSFKDPGELDLG